MTFSRRVGLWAVCICAVVVAGVSPSAAYERREFYNGVRGLGMGDTSIATVNDETALALNPAALGRLRDVYGTIFDPEIEAGNRVPDMIRAKSVSQPFTASSVVPMALLNEGKYYHAKMQMMPSFVARNFGIGLLGNYTFDAEAHSPTAVDVYSRDDLALLLGYNARLWGGRIKIGVTGKVISRIEMNEKNLDPTTQALDKQSLAAAGLLKEGVGVGADVGMLLTAPWTWLPTLGAVLRDVGNTSYDKMSGVRLKDATERPDMTKQDLDVGISLSPIHRNNVRSVWTIEYRGLLTASNETDKAKLMHFGVETNFGDVFFLRAGYNQRYWTAGAELASERFQFQVASYGEEIGDETKPREDRRTVLKFAFRF